MLARPLALLLVLAACSSTPAPAPDASPDVADVAADQAQPDALDAGRDAQNDVLPPPDSAFDVPDAPDAPNDRPHTSDPPPSPADDVMDVPGEAADTTDVTVIDAPDAADGVADAPVDAADAGPLTCPAGRGDCDGNAANGCETDLRSAVANCGMCGMACSFPGATAACTAGACTMVACLPDFGDCDGSPANGCEAPFESSTDHCSRCGASCRMLFPNGAGVCRDRRCALGACETGFGNCDADPANGCETNLNTTAINCGACTRRCSVANATAACTRGECSVGACNGGFGDCDGAPANGCETDVRTANSHCGGCGRACSGMLSVCRSGTCTAP